MFITGVTVLLTHGIRYPNDIVSALSVSSFKWRLSQFELCI